MSTNKQQFSFSFKTNVLLRMSECAPAWPLECAPVWPLECSPAWPFECAPAGPLGGVEEGGGGKERGRGLGRWPKKPVTLMEQDQSISKP